MLFLTLVWCCLLHWIIEICKKQDILASHQFFHLTNRSFSSMWKNSGTNSTHKLIPQVFCWVEVRLPVMTSLIFPARDMLPYTIIIKSCYFMVSSPHFDPTIHLLYTEYRLITEHDVPPNVQVLVHMLQTPVQTGLKEKASLIGFDGNLQPYETGDCCVQSVLDCLGREPCAILSCKITERLSEWSSCGVFFFTFLDIPHDVEPVPRHGAHYKKCCKSILLNTSCHIDRAISKSVKPCRLGAGSMLAGTPCHR